MNKVGLGSKSWWYFDVNEWNAILTDAL